MQLCRYVQSVVKKVDTNTIQLMQRSKTRILIQLKQIQKERRGEDMCNQKWEVSSSVTLKTSKDVETLVNITQNGMQVYLVVLMVYTDNRYDNVHLKLLTSFKNLRNKTKHEKRSEESTISISKSSCEIPFSGLMF